MAASADESPAPINRAARALNFGDGGLPNLESV
jgi:hypothetical protein